MQEEVTGRSVALTISAGKFTGRVLAAALRKALDKWQKHQQEALTPHGKQSVKKLMGHGVATNALPLDKHTRQFDRVARKFNVDYAFYKTAPRKYLLLFKAGQADAITQAFSEYTKRVMRKERGPSMLAQLRKFAEQARQQKPRHRERTKEAAHNDR